MGANVEGSRLGLFYAGVYIEIILTALKIFRQVRPCERTFGIEEKMAAASARCNVLSFVV
jgi:hypothetical protein